MFLQRKLFIKNIILTKHKVFLCYSYLLILINTTLKNSKNEASYTRVLSNKKKKKILKFSFAMYSKNSKDFLFT